MGGYYLFAFFVFVLFIFSVLIVKGLFFRTKNKDFEAHDEKLLRLYRQIEDMMESFEDYTEEIKKEIDDKKTAALEEIRAAQEKMLLNAAEAEEKKNIQQVTSGITDVQEFIKKSENMRLQKEREWLDEDKKKDKNESVMELYKQGEPIDEISRKLGIPAGEIKLIVEINV